MTIEIAPHDHYSVRITFKVNHSIISVSTSVASVSDECSRSSRVLDIFRSSSRRGSKVKPISNRRKRLLTAIEVDKIEQMLGSYGPHPKGEAYTKNFDPEESPSGMLARMSSYNVQSRVIDDDGEIYAGQ